MQIPNPLIRPRSLANPAAPTPASAPAEAAPAKAPPAGYGAAPIPLNAAGGAAVAEDPQARTVGELKDRFAAFYVSAIVGRQAMLRRSTAPRTVAPAAPSSMNLSAQALPPVAIAASQSRSDSVMLTDGELLDNVGTTGALVAKVTPRQVMIYHVQETMATADGKLLGKRTVVFAGDLENSGAAGQQVIVLERPDPAYRRMINVETRTRNASAAQSSDSTGGGGSANPLLPPGPLQ